LKRQCNDIDIVVKSQQFDAFRAAMLAMAKNRGYHATVGNVSMLNCANKSKWKFYRAELSVLGKAYQIDIREMASNLRKDAESRDFTINAIYIDIEQNCLQDFVGGTQDLHEGILRGCSDPKTVFSDKARAIRMHRFYLNYDFKLDQELLDAAKELKISTGDRIPAIISETIKVIHSPLRYSILRSLALNLSTTIILQAFVRDFSNKMNYFMFNQDLIAICQAFESKSALIQTPCPIYGKLDETILLKIMLSFIMLCSMPKSTQWHIKDYQVQSSLLVTRFFGNQYSNSVWIDKLLLLMVITAKDDYIINDQDFKDSIVGQLPLPIAVIMATSAQCGDRARSLLADRVKSSIV
jgi:Poly A polymerase head domain